MQAGALDRRIVIERLGPPVDDGMRVKPGGWFTLATVWAALTPLSAAERIAAGEVAAFQMQKFRIRRTKSLTITPDGHRLRYNGQIYDIAGVQEVVLAAFGSSASSREAVEIIATARAEPAAQEEEG